MSPEQATGDQAIGPASDTLSLACVLYEMLVGEPPYPGSTAQPSSSGQCGHATIRYSVRGNGSGDLTGWTVDRLCVPRDGHASDGGADGPTAPRFVLVNNFAEVLKQMVPR